MKFVANDGVIFDDIMDCRNYETELAIKAEDEKKKQIYLDELVNIKSFNIAFDDHNITLFVHSLDNHKLFAIMISESIFGSALKFKDDQIISDHIISTYKITTNKTVNLDTINDENVMLFEAYDVPKIFDDGVNTIVYTPSGFTYKNNIIKSKELEAELENNIEKDEDLKNRLNETLNNKSNVKTDERTNENYYDKYGIIENFFDFIDFLNSHQ